MSRLIIGCLIFLSPPFLCYTEDNAWLKQIDAQAVEKMKSHLKDYQEKLPAKKDRKLLTKKDGNIVLSECNTCINQAEDIFTDPKVFIAMSFSVPENIWISLSKELEKIEGTFVLCGLPNNSFKELAVRILSLKNKGVNAQIQLDPKLFQECEITQVPTFIVKKDNSYDKLMGNVSLKFALSKMNSTLGFVKTIQNESL